MNPVLRVLVEQGGGLVTRWLAGQVVPSWTLDRASRAGHLCRVLPGVYLDARLVTPMPGRPPLASVPPELARRAALEYAAGQGALSHLSALNVWGVRQQTADEPVHLTVPAHSTLRSRPHLVVHHRRHFTVAQPQVVMRRDVPVTPLDRSLLDAWPVLPPAERPAPIIRAVNDRRTTAERLRAELCGLPKLPHRAELRVLLDRLAAGCRSPLEIWGHDHVFTGPGMPPLKRQVRVRVGGRTSYLDVYAEAERVNIELDGASTHDDPRQREIDLRRDALLATLGILVVRFTHRRLVHEPDQVRREVLAILAARRWSAGGYGPVTSPGSG
ncbi:DUF559 domain-containing protein [Micromonospora sp. CPCC 206060]|uniref:DUF559 domain-containing protein n=1 Tax=Micromonospora sp. CPCC 206060 TaxID=3122406 RepID=UPI002FEF7AC7